MIISTASLTYKELLAGLGLISIACQLELLRYLLN